MHKYEEVEVFGLSQFNDLNVHYLLFFSLFFKAIERNQYVDFFTSNEYGTYRRCGWVTYIEIHSRRVCSFDKSCLIRGNLIHWIRQNDRSPVYILPKSIQFNKLTFTVVIDFLYDEVFVISVVGLYWLYLASQSRSQTSIISVTASSNLDQRNALDVSDS